MTTTSRPRGNAKTRNEKRRPEQATPSRGKHRNELCGLTFWHLGPLETQVLYSLNVLGDNNETRNAYYWKVETGIKSSHSIKLVNGLKT